MTGEQKAELEKKLHEMGTIVSVFYTMAQGVHVHQFLEHTGLINEYVKACRKMLDDGIDFVENHVELTEYMAEYIGEKMGCIYGEALDNVHMWKAFEKGVKK